MDNWDRKDTRGESQSDVVLNGTYQEVSTNYIFKDTTYCIP